MRFSKWSPHLRKQLLGSSQKLRSPNTSYHLAGEDTQYTIQGLSCNIIFRIQDDDAQTQLTDSRAKKKGPQETKALLFAQSFTLKQQKNQIRSS